MLSLLQSISQFLFKQEYKWSKTLHAVGAATLSSKYQGAWTWCLLVVFNSYKNASTVAIYFLSQNMKNVRCIHKSQTAEKMAKCWNFICENLWANNFRIRTTLLVVNKSVLLLKKQFVAQIFWAIINFRFIELGTWSNHPLNMAQVLYQQLCYVCNIQLCCLCTPCHTQVIRPNLTIFCIKNACFRCYGVHYFSDYFCISLPV